jgi:hypothetical protein
MRHQRILWWVFAVNLICGGLGASVAARVLGSALHHSLAGEKLSRGFDLGMLMELASQPEVRLFDHFGPSFLFAIIFFLFMLFVTPGIITVYIEDRSFTTGEFLAAAGSFFWPFVRLFLWSLIPFFAVHFLYHGISELASYVGERSVSAQTGFYIDVGGGIILLLLVLWVRMWFDAAQVRAIMLQERAMRRNVNVALRLAGRRLWSVYRAYVLIGVLVGIVTVLLIAIWVKLPPTALVRTFLLLELIMLAHIFGRLWQKACTTSWYVWHAEVPLIPSKSAPDVPALPVEPIEDRFGVRDVDAPLSPEVEGAPEDRTFETKPE